MNLLKREKNGNYWRSSKRNIPDKYNSKSMLQHKDIYIVAKKDLQIRKDQITRNLAVKVLGVMLTFANISLVKFAEASWL